MKIGAVITYCSLDYKFIKHCVDKVRPLCDHIVIPVCDHFFNGTKENHKLLDKTMNEIKDVKFVKFKYDSKFKIPQKRYWMTYSRFLGAQNLDKPIKDVLLLDADEIIDTNRMEKYLNKVNNYSAIEFACYWYFRDPKYRAKKIENAGLLVKRFLLTKSKVINFKDRVGVFRSADIRKRYPNVKSLDNVPMVHHYSWVRTKEELLIKVKNWGHRGEKPWANLIEEEFSRDFNGTDFIHNYRYETVKPFIEI